MDEEFMYDDDLTIKDRIVMTAFVLGMLIIGGGMLLCWSIKKIWVPTRRRE